MADRLHTLSTATPGTVVGSPEFATPLGDAAARNYVTLGGKVWAGFGYSTTGAPLATNTSVNDPNPAPAGLGASMATQLWIGSGAPIGAAVLLVRFLAGTTEIGSVLLNTDRTLRGRSGGGAFIGTASTAMATDTAYTLTAGTLASATAGQGSGFWSLKALDGTVLGSGTVTGTAANGTANVTTITIGKAGAVTGQVAFRAIRFRNSYDPAITPASDPIVLKTTRDSLQRIRAGESTGSNLALTNVRVISGGTGIGPLVVSGLDITFVDNPARQVPVRVAFTLTGDGENQPEGVVDVPPPSGAAQGIVRSQLRGGAYV